MAFDYKNECRALYMPKTTPGVVDVPFMRFIAVNGAGNPNDPDGEYQKALGILYPVAYAIKMSYKTDYHIDGFFEYVVPPLEGLWWTDNAGISDFTDKSTFKWTAMIRVPDFVNVQDVEWAKAEVLKKKKLDCSLLCLITFEEGLCAQVLHIGPYDAEPVTLAAVDRFIETNGYVKDVNSIRRHHEIYISDPRKTSPDKMKTVLRIPIAKHK